MRQGFTLPELLIAVCIVGALVVLAYTLFTAGVAVAGIILAWIFALFLWAVFVRTGSLLVAFVACIPTVCLLFHYGLLGGKG